MGIDRLWPCTVFCIFNEEDEKVNDNENFALFSCLVLQMNNLGLPIFFIHQWDMLADCKTRVVIIFELQSFITLTPSFCSHYMNKYKIHTKFYPYLLMFRSCSIKLKFYLVACIISANTEYEPFLVASLLMECNWQHLEPNIREDVWPRHYMPSRSGCLGDGLN